MPTVARGFDLADCVGAVSAIEAELNALTSALTEAQFHAKPPDGGWSVSYCLEHLVLTGNAFLPKWDVALKEAGRRKSCREDGFAYSWWQRRTLLLLEPPYTIRRKTRRLLEPCAHRPIHHTVERFLNMHRSVLGRIESSLGLDVMQTKAQSPFNSWVWYPLGFSFDLALAHERRHLWQAREAAAGVPG
jgi:hypothetical protein